MAVSCGVFSGVGGQKIKMKIVAGTKENWQTNFEMQPQLNL